MPGKARDRGNIRQDVEKDEFPQVWIAVHKTPEWV